MPFTFIINHPQLINTHKKKPIKQWQIFLVFTFSSSCSSQVTTSNTLCFLFLLCFTYVLSFSFRYYILHLFYLFFKENNFQYCFLSFLLMICFFFVHHLRSHNILHHYFSNLFRLFDVLVLCFKTAQAALLLSPPTSL